jgi:hypothetical protein
MPNLYVKEVWVDRTRNCQLGDSGVYESGHVDAGTLYKALMREYGRCTGRVYIDLPDKPAKPIGWVFVKRAKYEDTKAPYLQETRVSVHSSPDTVTREEHFADL